MFFISPNSNNLYTLIIIQHFLFVYLGMYRTLSASTKPTRKKRLEAGRKGKTIRINDTSTGSGTLSVVL